MNIKLSWYFLVSLLLFIHAPISLSNTEQSQRQLNQMSNMVGGKWWLGTDSYKTFSWGLGNSQIKMRHVVITAEKERVVGEGFFYYAPNSFSIKGVSTFQDKGQEPVLLEYFGNVEAGNLEFVFKSILPSGETTIFTEKWERVNENQYNWTLASLEDEVGVKKGTYIRKLN